MNNQQRVLAQLSTHYGRTAGGIAWSARLTYEQTIAVLMALSEKGLAAKDGEFWVLVESGEAA